MMPNMDDKNKTTPTSSNKGERAKLADVLADIRKSRQEDDDAGPTPSKRRAPVNYVALSGLTPRQGRTQLTNLSRQPQSNPIDIVSAAQSPDSFRNRCVLKLFDRSLDLTQFTNSCQKDPPLYPMCRAWVQGQRLESELKETSKFEALCDKGNSNLINSTTIQQDSPAEAANEVHMLPAPKSKQESIEFFKLDSQESDMDIRIPDSVRSFKKAENLEETFDKSLETMGHHECLELNKKRWSKVRKDWAEARRMHEWRYEESFKWLTKLVAQPR